MNQSVTIIVALLVGQANSDKYDDNIDFVVHKDRLDDSPFLWTNESLVLDRRCDKNGNL